MKRLARISVRLLLFNVLLVFLPAAGLFLFGTYEDRMLEAQERAMVQEGRLVAAALSGPVPIDGEGAMRLFSLLGGRREARFRVVGPDGVVLADSSRIPAVEAPAERPYFEPGTTVRKGDPRGRIEYRLGAAVWAVYRFLTRRPESTPYPGSLAPSVDPLPKEVVAKALDGRYGATFRASPGQRSLTLYAAIPIRNGSTGAVTGAVVVSQSTVRILRALWTVRLDLFRVVLVSLVAAALLSLLLSMTIARPLVRLRNEADELVDRRGRLRRAFRGSNRSDEIGDLTRALSSLTARLEAHVLAVEAFSSDVAHEFRNPLASIRTATEMLAEAEDPADRRRFLQLAEREVARLEELLSGVLEISRVDARLSAEAAPPVDLRALLAELVDGIRLRPAGRVRIDLTGGDAPLPVAASPERLAQVFENLLDNAAGFSPDGGRIELHAEAAGGFAVVRVSDEGPGIPEPHRERIFDRFFSFRPGEREAKRAHTGLGLAIARAIVEAYGGSITAQNLPVRGARFEVRLPISDGGASRS